MDGSHLQSRQPTPKGVFAKRKTFTTPNVFDALGLGMKMIIRQEDRQGLRGEIYNLGISRASLFPGLDSVCDDISWRHRQPYIRQMFQARISQTYSNFRHPESRFLM